MANQYGVSSSSMISELYWPYKRLSAGEINSSQATNRDYASQLPSQAWTSFHDDLGTPLRCASVAVARELCPEEVYRELLRLSLEELCIIHERLCRRSGICLCFAYDIGVCVEDTEAVAWRVRPIIELISEPVTSLRLIQHIRPNSAQCIFYPFRLLRLRIEQNVNAIRIHCRLPS